MCIDIVKILFWIANGQISSSFDRVICLPNDSGGVLSFHDFMFHLCNFVTFVQKVLPEMSSM